MPPAEAHPGVVLKTRFLDPLGITPYRLAQGIGVHVRRVSELCKGKRPVTPDTAARLGLFFNVPPVWWLEMQARYDAQHIPNLEDLKVVVSRTPKLELFLVTPNGVIPRDPSPSPKGQHLTAPPELLARLRAQVALEPAAEPRTAYVVDYGNGFVALTSEEA